jgi:hypothetical protein
MDFMTTEVLCLTGMFLAAALQASAAPLATAFDDDGMVTVNGKRTLIIGSYYGAKSDRPFEELSEAGFNLVHSGADKESLDKAQAGGLMTWVSVGAVDPAKADESSKTITDAVLAVKDHPSLAFIETVDEPAWSWLKAETRVPWQVLADTFKVIKQADANHLVYTNHAPTNLVKTLKQYNAGTDIVACDIYPVNPGGVMSMFAFFPDGFQGDFNDTYISQVGRYADKMRQVTGPNRPLLMVLQAFAWEELLAEKDVVEKRSEKIVYPSYAESRFMAYQSLIRGANGIIYWGSFSMPQPSDAWTGIKRVTREIADLSGPLSERKADVTPEIDYQEMGHTVDEGVQTLVKAHDGKLYVFTCNADKNLCKATMSGLGEWKQCTVVNENRPLPVENGAVTDTWRRFDAHVYEFSN